MNMHKLLASRPNVIAQQVPFDVRAPPPLGELTAIHKIHSWIKGSLLLKQGHRKGVEGGEGK